jgi:hypothetical protein
VGCAAQSDDPGSTLATSEDAVTIDPSDFVSHVTNPLFPLKPGTTFTFRILNNSDADKDVQIVLSSTRLIMGVTCTEVHDTVTLGNQVKEDTIDYYAQDKHGTVWYFGEKTTEYLPNGQVTHEGSWIAGKDGAQAGTMMEAHPRVGDHYRQEYEPGVAEDSAKVIAVDVSVHVPYGTFDDCVRTRETTALDPTDISEKTYCPQVGEVLEKQVGTSGNEIDQLVSVTH